MKSNEMIGPVGLVLMFLVLYFTVVGAQDPCDASDARKIMSCASIFDWNIFSPKWDTCEKELITKKFCRDMILMHLCMIQSDISPVCLEDSSTETDLYVFGCSLNDVEKICTEVLERPEQCDYDVVEKSMSCISDSFLNFLLHHGASCNTELITKDLCTDFLWTMECFIKKDISSYCLMYNVTEGSQQNEFDCTVRHLEEKCIDDRFIKRHGDSVQTTKPGGTSIQTRNSPSKTRHVQLRGQTKGARGGSVTHTSFALLIVITILLLFISMQIV
ncbi:uncharacterized protein LOC112569124 [Pomacea canaliculata]|uniref:uncharacterized protein LOC112569124 n=1 Tax=Pomacea canaliculata TaxID=400727 RepID=UPI000D733E77|nr:uncharacterized protein LOC112569124 [Pomacea canaliculata]